MEASCTGILRLNHTVLSIGALFASIGCFYYLLYALTEFCFPAPVWSFNHTHSPFLPTPLAHFLHFCSARCSS